MDSPRLHQIDPTLQLLNEIEVLLAQAGLLALYLKQVYAAAEAEVAQGETRRQADDTSAKGIEGC